MEHAAHHPASSDPSLVLFAALIVLPALILAAYLRMAWREGQASPPSAMRVASFATGIVLIIAAMSPPISHWAHQDLRGHMVQHLLLGMFAPLGLALGAPGTLLLRNVPAPVARDLVAFLGTRPVRFVIHPITAALLGIGGMYVLYLTPLYALSVSEPTVHLWVHLHFVISGYLFTWSIAGPDPAPHRPSMSMRLAVLLLATAAHASLGKIMYAYGYPRGTHADLAEMEAAAQWMYYGGDVAEALLAVAFFAVWFRGSKSSQAVTTAGAVRA